MALTHPTLSIPIGQGLESAADLSEKVGYWGKMNSGEWDLAVGAAGSEDGIAIITDGGTASGDPCVCHRGLVQALLGESVSVGDYVTQQESTGKTEKADDTGQRILGIATEDGESGNLCWIEVSFVYGAKAATAA